MPLLLNIDTSGETASLAVTLDGRSIAYVENNQQKEHASFIHKGIAIVLEQSGVNLSEIDVFAVTTGPGSYTGLRVALATAKGFCYALKKPLVTINTLVVMTKAAIDAVGATKPDMLFCPMLDARRMEVFTALYNIKLETILPPAAVILQPDSFDSYIAGERITFYGSGSYKFEKILTDAGYLFAEVKYNAKTLGSIADITALKNEYADVSYCQPAYLKDVYFASKG